jgi:broad specificity phosphatase PhoE
VKATRERNKTTTTTTTTTTMMTPPPPACKRRNQTIYFCRHAEATHNIKEREAIQEAIAQGVHEKSQQEEARRAVLDDITLTDAPLSEQGIHESRLRSSNLDILNKISNGTTSLTSSCKQRYPTPTLVLVSPLRRALMTATELFYNNNNNNKNTTTTKVVQFVAMEAIREKRTGFAADERSSVDDLEREFPHVDFSDLRMPERAEIQKGEDNVAVRARARDFLDGHLSGIHEESIAVVTHKGWLRELRQALKARVDSGDLCADFDLDAWHQTLYKNAEVRVAQFGWENDPTTSSNNSKLVSIVSRSVENAMGSVISDAVKHLIEKSQKQAAAMASMTMTYNKTSTTSPICYNTSKRPMRGRNTSESTLATECTMVSMSDNDEDASSSSGAEHERS